MKRVMLRLYIVYLLFALAFNALLFPVWAAFSGWWSEEGASLLGMLPVGAGFLIAGAILIQAAKIKATQRKAQEAKKEADR